MSGTDTRATGGSSLARHPHERGEDPGRGNRVRLVLAQLLCGVGIASGAAVGGVLAQHLSQVMGVAGFAQTASIVGAGVAAIPLARLASRRGRRWSLTAGFSTAAIGAALILLAVATAQFWLYLVAMVLFGAGSATNLQSRYAAVDYSRPGAEARSMAIVLWATTIGSIAGPNLSAPGARFGATLGIDPLGGPYAFALAGFVLAAAVVATLRPIGSLERATARTATRTAKRAVKHKATPSDAASGAEARRDAVADDETRPAAPTGVEPTRAPSGTIAALRVAVRHPRALFALACVIGGQSMMATVMVMTPVTMNDEGVSLEVIGLVISVHIVGMYAASPLFGWLADRIGPARVAWAGIALFLLAFLVGGCDAVLYGGATAPLMAALLLLGLGWSACLIGGSALLVDSVPQRARLPLQGASDALMNFGAAALGALAGPVLALGGFFAVNLIALVVLLLLVITGVRATRRPTRPATG